MFDNESLLSRLDAAIKAVTDITEMGDAILQPEKFDRLIRSVQERTVILPEARFMRMDSDVVEIDATGFVGRILRSGATNTGASRTLTETEFVSPAFTQSSLTAKELQAITSIRDRALRRNIERGNFENTLIDLFGEAAGRDLEEYAIFADTNIPYATDDVLSRSDGWVREAGNKLYGVDTATFVAKDFDPAAGTWPINLFEAMLLALPKKFLQNVGEWRFYVGWDVMNAYREELASRTNSSGLADVIITQGTLPNYKGIPIVYVPMLERAPAVTTAQADKVEGDVAMLQHPDNMVWGVFHEVTIEREREAKERRTDFVLTVEADAGYEDPAASVVALIDKTNPALA